jgi:formiminoglutamase
MSRIKTGDYQLVPPGLSMTETAPDDPRCGSFISRSLSGIRKGDIVLIGFCSDEGVRRNNGRPGAAKAPDLIRNAFFRMTPDPMRHYAFTHWMRRTHDAGNIIAGAGLEEAQQTLGALTAALLEAGACPVILGGGHETTFGHFLGYAKAGRQVTILNIDAHPDVREPVNGLGHSGSPFRQILEHPGGLCREYRVAGLQPQSVARAHLDYLRSHNSLVRYAGALNKEALDTLLGDTSTGILMSMDMDAVDSAHAPGVSAPSAFGLSPAIWLHSAFSAGRNRNVHSFDLVEVNPAFDIDNRTVRLAALTLWYFIKGRAELD